MNPQQDNQNGQQIGGQQAGAPQMFFPGQPQPAMPTQNVMNQNMPMQNMPFQSMPGDAGMSYQSMPGGQNVPVGQTMQNVPNMQQMPNMQMAQGMPMQNMQAQGMQAQNMQNLGSAAMAAQQAKPISPNRDVPTSTQATLMISELRDNVVIMRDGSFRAVIACKSINFDLMSDAEREAVEYSYQNFLNSLKFTTQILIRSQKVDIGPYIEKLIDIRKNNDNMLLGVLMDDYINFIDVLSQEANIMDKSFFIVIPYYTSVDAEKALQQTKNFFKSFSKVRPQETIRIDRATYDKAISELNSRVDAVMNGLYQVGVHSVRLNTRELAELYYNFNNPDTAVREPLVDFSKIATMYVRKGESNG